MSKLEHGRAELTEVERRRLVSLLGTNERQVMAATGLSREPLYRAAAGLRLYGATRHAIRIALTELVAQD